MVLPEGRRLEFSARTYLLRDTLDALPFTVIIHHIVDVKQTSNIRILPAQTARKL